MMVWIIVGDALPFTIKMYESLAASDPTHAGMARTVGMLEILYANAYIAGPADYLGVEHYGLKRFQRRLPLPTYNQGSSWPLFPQQAASCRSSSSFLWVDWTLALPVLRLRVLQLRRS